MLPTSSAAPCNCFAIRFDFELLLPVLNDTSTIVREGAVNQYYRRSEGGVMGYALRTNSYRFIEWRKMATGEVITRELYDHQTEHSESHNIIEEVDPELIERLTEQLLTTHPRKSLTLLPAVHASTKPQTVPVQLPSKTNIHTKSSSPALPVKEAVNALPSVSLHPKR